MADILPLSYPAGPIAVFLPSTSLLLPVVVTLVMLALSLEIVNRQLGKMLAEHAIFGIVATKKGRPTQLGHRIRTLREQRGMSQLELARLVGVTRGYISQIETGIQQDVNAPLLRDIAGVLGVPTSDLLAAAGYIPSPAEQPGVRRRRPAHEIMRELEESLPLLVPETSQPASAGAGVVVEAEYWPYMPAAGERGHRFIAVPVSGDCMEPEIRSGHRVIVDLDASPRPGDIVLAIHDGESLVKILEERDGQMYLVALREQPPIRVDDQTRVLGVVRTVVYRPSVPHTRGVDRGSGGAA